MNKITSQTFTIAISSFSQHLPKEKTLVDFDGQKHAPPTSWNHSLLCEVGGFRLFLIFHILDIPLKTELEQHANFMRHAELYLKPRRKKCCHSRKRRNFCTSLPQFQSYKPKVMSNHNRRQRYRCESLSSSSIDRNEKKSEVNVAE